MGQEAGGEWLEWVLGLNDAVLCGDPAHSVCDHNLLLHPPHSRWSSHQRPEVSHKYSSLDVGRGNQLRRMRNTMSSLFHFQQIYVQFFSHLPESMPLKPPTPGTLASTLFVSSETQKHLSPTPTWLAPQTWQLLVLALSPSIFFPKKVKRTVKVWEAVVRAAGATALTF